MEKKIINDGAHCICEILTVISEIMCSILFIRVIYRAKLLFNIQLIEVLKHCYERTHNRESTYSNTSRSSLINERAKLNVDIVIVLILLRNINLQSCQVCM